MSILRTLRAPAGIGLAALLIVLPLLSCDDGPAGSMGTGPRAGRSVLPAAPGTAGAAGDVGVGVIGGPDAWALGALAGKLPSTDTVTSGVPAFEIKQKGSGQVMRAEITNSASAALAISAVHQGGGAAVQAWNLGTGRGLNVVTSNATNAQPALDVSSQSLGIAPTATTPGTAAALDVRANSTASANPAVQLATSGTGPVLNVNHRGTDGDIAVFQVAGVNKARINRSGKGFFNAGVKNSGADVAEAFEVEGSVSAYRPGDVLAISRRSDRRVERSDEPYSTRIAGVYATRPGVLLTERDVDAPDDDTVPMGIIGVIPTRVSGENGPIRRGDLLVGARTPGHAMRGDPDRLRVGMVLGKALEDHPGRGTGMIRVLVNVK